MDEHCFVVFTKPTAGMESEFNRWYDQQHLPDVLAVPGIVSAKRFCATIGGERQYLALYNMKTNDPDAVLADIQARAGTDKMVMSPALDMDSITAVVYAALEPVKA